MLNATTPSLAYRDLRYPRLGAMRSGNVFTPSGLFALAEPGVWYDPSDLTTLFQDTAGTTPVTTPGQTVARMLDKSRGLTLGSEIVTNGTFDSNVTGWSSQANTTISWLTGELRGVSSSGSNTFAFQDLTTVSGVTYRYNATVRAQAGNILVTAYNGAFTALLESVTVTGPTTSQTVSLVFTATGTTTRLGIGPSVATTFFLDNISVRELPGFHATQSTAASRPTYGIVPAGGRRNLLTRTEEFDNAAWTKAATTVGTTTDTPSSSIAAFDVIETATNATHIISQRFTFTAGVQYTISVRAKYNGRHLQIAPGNTIVTGGYAAFDLQNGVVGNLAGTGMASAITSLGSGWYLCSATFTAASTATSNPALATVPSPTSARLATYLGDGVSGVKLAGVQFEVGSTATAYQRVGSAFDVTEAGVASLSYLSFDGVDDFLVTPTITPGVDKAQVFAGVRILSTASTGVLAETSVAVAANSGSFTIMSPDASVFRVYLNGGGNLVQANSPATAPSTVLQSAIFDIAGASEIALRLNGSQVSSSSGGATGNFNAYPLYIGRRGGTSLPFNGNIFSLVVRFGANLDAGTITNTERWVGGKTGVTI